MPEPIYPCWDDERFDYTMDQPGVYFDLPLASYITHPPDLTLKHSTPHSMQLPENQNDLETAGFNAADGCAEQQDHIPLATNRADVTLVDTRAFADARVVYAACDQIVHNAYRNLKIARDNARAWLLMAVSLLMPTLGRKPSAAWVEPGFSDESLAVPHSEDQIVPTLRKQIAYLGKHPELQLADPRFNYTAARAGVLLAAIEFALKNADTTDGKPLGVKPAEKAATEALRLRDLTEAALRRRLHGLYAELEQKIDPLSPLWVLFGFDQPGAQNRPDPVDKLTVTPLGQGRSKLEWTGGARADRFQIWQQTAGQVGWTLLARTDGARLILLENLTVGAKMKFRVRGVNDTNVGPFSPEVEVTMA